MKRKLKEIKGGFLIDQRRTRNRDRRWKKYSIHELSSVRKRDTNAQNKNPCFALASSTIRWVVNLQENFILQTCFGRELRGIGTTRHWDEAAGMRAMRKMRAWWVADEIVGQRVCQEKRTINVDKSRCMPLRTCGFIHLNLIPCFLANMFRWHAKCFHILQKYFLHVVYAITNQNALYLRTY